jgi:hypothetical protein
MAILYGLWSFGIFFPIWYVRTKKNLATLIPHREKRNNSAVNVATTNFANFPQFFAEKIDKKIQ